MSEREEQRNKEAAASALPRPPPRQECPARPCDRGVPRPAGRSGPAVGGLIDPRATNHDRRIATLLGESPCSRAPLHREPLPVPGCLRPLQSVILWGKERGVKWGWGKGMRWPEYERRYLGGRRLMERNNTMPRPRPSRTPPPLPSPPPLSPARQTSTAPSQPPPPTQSSPPITTPASPLQGRSVPWLRRARQTPARPPHVSTRRRAPLRSDGRHTASCPPRRRPSRGRRDARFPQCRRPSLCSTSSSPPPPPPLFPLTPFFRGAGTPLHSNAPSPLPTPPPPPTILFDSLHRLVFRGHSSRRHLFDGHQRRNTTLVTPTTLAPRLPPNRRS
ncbi:proline-rich protein 36-like [Ischnura elegans]|uniref:proline-rich protein 36-like n=1 Tax=Ischnura elegans TaxID=197161 RepID=UPI001ED88187|nr:proline-rich protein 36-like [Ischnura elegans]